MYFLTLATIMNTKHSGLLIALLPLFGISVTANADIIAVESLNGMTHQFNFASQEEAANVFADNSLLAPFNNPLDRTGQVIQVSDTDTNKSFTVIRAAYDTYVIAQPADNGQVDFVTIQKQGGVQQELYNYLLGNPTNATQSGINTATLSKVTAIIDKVKVATPDSSVTNATKTNFINALTSTFTQPTETSTILPTGPFGTNLATAAKGVVNNYLKNGMLQGNPASYIAQMAYYDQTLDLGGVAASQLGHEANHTAQKSRLALKARMSNYSFSTQELQVYTVTPSYTYELSKGWALLFDVPLTYVDRANSTSSYNVSMAMGVRVPVARYDTVNWDVVPLARMGGVNLDCINSHDLTCADSSFVYSGGVQSNLGIVLGAGYSLVVQDQYSYQNVDALATRVNVFNGLASVLIPNGTVHVYRNGAQLFKQSDYTVLGRTVLSSLTFADTRFDSSYGSFIDSQQEYGFNLNLHSNARGSIAVHDLKIGISYTDAKGMSDAISGTIAVTF